MGFVDGPKRNGRFLKKASAVLKGVQLTDFSFAEITEARIQILDNTLNSVLHVKYHDPEDLKESLQPPSILGTDLQTQGRQIIFPRDFTRDWYREKDRIKRRTVRPGEDDDEIDLEEEAAQALEAKRRAEARNSSKQNSDNRGGAPRTGAPTSVAPKTEKNVEPGAPHATPAAPPVQATQDAVALPPHNSAIIPPEMENMRQFSEQKKTIDEVGDLIKGLKPTLMDEDPSSPEDAVAESTGFRPLVSHGVMATAEPHMTPTTERSSVISRDEVDVAAIREEAQREGYSEGFKIGEEKASLQTRQTTMQLVSHIQSLLQELVGLKGRVLQSAQNNFVDVVQALAEALLKREFSVNPEALVAVINRAIRDVVGQDQIKIAIHPATYAVIESASSKEFLDSIIKDESIAPGDFRIDSKLTTVDGNAAELIKTMLNKADLSITSEGSRDTSKKVS